MQRYNFSVIYPNVSQIFLAQIENFIPAPVFFADLSVGLRWQFAQVVPPVFCPEVSRGCLSRFQG